MILCGLFITTSSLLMAAMLGALRLWARFWVRDSSCLLQNKGLFLKSFRNRKLYLHCYSILSTKVSDKHFFKLYRSVLFFLISHLKFILSFSLLSTCSFKLLSCNFSKIKFVPWYSCRIYWLHRSLQNSVKNTYKFHRSVSLKNVDCIPF